MSEQLALPIEGLSQRPSTVGLPRPQRVFVNRNLAMSNIEWVGFDMDYTLAIYDQEAMDRLSIEVTAQKLVERGYPSWVTTIPYDPTFPIRGVLIDKKLGHVVKMDRYKSVGKAYRGFRPLPRPEVQKLYHAIKHRAPTSRYHFVDTLYALSEVALYAGLIDAYDARGKQVDHVKLFADIREAIDEAHRDGTVPTAITQHFDRYIRRDPNLGPTLHKLRSAGKRLFVLTNSRRAYTDTLMSYLLGTTGTTEYPTWRHYFDVIVVGSGKPGFFQEHRPFMERVHEDRDESALRPAQTIERGRIYEGGNLHDFERMVGIIGDRVLYVGDHIYGDILRSKKESAWRTLMIIQEMDIEVAAHDACLEALEQHEDFEDRRARLEDELRFHQARFKEAQRLVETFSPVSGRGGRAGLDGAAAAFKAREAEADRTRAKRSVERVRTLLREIEVQTRELEQRIDQSFHPYWGSLLKEGVETSSFGDQVEEYACLYTSRVSNLFHYSPLQTFRSPRDLMPHEL